MFCNYPHKGHLQQESRTNVMQGGYNQWLAMCNAEVHGSQSCLSLQDSTPMYSEQQV